MTTPTSSRRRHTLAMLAATAAVTLAAALPAPAAAQAWPSKPIRVVVNFPPGGAADQLARLIGQPLSEVLGQPVVIENRGGAGGNLGGEVVAKSAPDGYTLLMSSGGMVSVNPHIYPRMPFDPAKDLTPVAPILSYYNVLVVNNNEPYKSVRELVATAKSNPGKLAYGSAGVGGSNHLGALLFAKRSGIEMNHIPYKGNAPAMTDVIGGQLNMMLDIISTASAYIHSGKVRAIAVTSPQRNASLPDVPTFAESGIEGLKGFDVGGWYGVYGPKGMAPELVAKLNKAVNAVLAQPDLNKRFKELGYDEWTGSPQKLAERAAKERAMWATVTQGIVVD